MSDPRTSASDLTARAKIRNAALDLYSEHGEDRVSMRMIAAQAGVTVGLVQHHFKTKDGLRDAVEQLVVDYHAQAIADAPSGDSPAESAAARDRAVAQMLHAHPPVVNYMRRVLLDPHNSGGTLLARLTELSRQGVVEMRGAGQASTDRSVADQTLGLMIKHVGHLFLQPMVDAMWAQLTADDEPPADKPVLSVTARTTD
ncbi:MULTISPECIES: TetR/AcrR family transcriptional regulator [Gordonia]|jgi:AcrR family transcriptional regulator|uniref:Putative TetR family transcriptional regulator n=1 Tax=Gordonia malaquae NBRC 108250 TaxID=1223542 RepID=M3TG47_GORML|nr:TetR/AcrR family transcriptional regulator [Gordonia malaquae]GAC80441.1 putative TetR family transcriptional regulator [Gordonia malaquae NBRC 108250]SEE13751.1 DNA-binding transcriptional regulator, AcrR family [Gordonia malaquae]